MGLRLHSFPPKTESPRRCPTDVLEFLEVVPCLKTAILNHKEDCEVWVNVVLNEIRKYPEYVSIRNTISQHCIKNTCTAECYRLYMLGECGKTAEYIYSKILQRSFFYLLKCNSPKQHQLAFTLVNYLHQNLDQGVEMYLIQSQLYYQPMMANY
ncbi:hypothetical protein AVEN_199314-1 [Araneus ventricosus]|uniref:Uncharacterized protein n=1 Tax=Araneus ventricosus TaxID=182803 RepID=A0A4Y2H6U1_ARAVE|nr:hypothetical protein AVEN_199314-1 [Araneus ventricosus]